MISSQLSQEVSLFDEIISELNFFDLTKRERKREFGTHIWINYAQNLNKYYATLLCKIQES